MTDDDLSRIGGAYRLERSIGTVSGVSVEVWRSMVSGDVELVVWPAVQGFRTVARGSMAELSMLADLGGVIFRTLESTAPLLTGEWFGGGRSGIIDRPSSDNQQ